jgi:hypothetical protein
LRGPQSDCTKFIAARFLSCCWDYCQVEAREELAPGSEQELEIRAATVVAVDRMRAALQKQMAEAVKAGAQDPGTLFKSVMEKDAGPRSAGQVLSLALDWYLWELGEQNIDKYPPHHRTLTIYY